MLGWVVLIGLLLPSLRALRVAPIMMMDAGCALRTAKSMKGAASANIPFTDAELDAAVRSLQCECTRIEIAPVGSTRA